MIEPKNHRGPYLLQLSRTRDARELLERDNLSTTLINHYGDSKETNPSP